MSVKSVMSEIEGLIKNAVMSCASMYGFSAEEALAKIDSNGNLIKAVVDKEQKKAEKQRLMEQKKAEKEQEKAEKQRLVEQKKAEKEQKETEKKQKEAELASMKEEEILSKAAEKLALKQKKEAEKKPKKVKPIAPLIASLIASPIASLEDEEPFIRFQNIPLINEINSIRDVKKFKNWKKLSAGVKLARQIIDI